jgi:molybdenum-dependent DNA-binding transcriptional regulator ModE
VHRIQLHYTLSRDAGDAQIRNPLPEMLEAVAQQGSISGRSAHAGHVVPTRVGALKRWEEQLGGELIIWGKGQSAQLSEFGTKLLWAERQAQARLAPQIAALHADLERAFAVAFDDSAHVLTMYASHDDALASLRAHAATRHFRHCTWTSLHRQRGRHPRTQRRPLHLAGFHTLEQPAATSLAARTYKPLLQPGLHKIIGFARRTQGLIVAAGNPLGLQSLTDVARTGARFANRPWAAAPACCWMTCWRRKGSQASTLRVLNAMKPRTPQWHRPWSRCG